MPERILSRTAVLPFLAAVLVIAGFAALLFASRSYVWNEPAGREPYNLLVRGFQSGHVWLAADAPAALAHAPDPYRFQAYRPYLSKPWNLVDLSYYRGHLYIYFGVTPAILLFWPYFAVTGRMLHQAHAVLLFSVLGYATAAWLATSVRRRYFPEVGPWTAAAVALLLGSATTLPVFLVRPGLFEVPISCAYALTMLAVAALWNAWHRPGSRLCWIAAASLAYGLAVGARPTVLFGAVILFLPAAALFRARHERPGEWKGCLVAALVPIGAVGLALAAYNQQRFGDPLQFGHAYQLSGFDAQGKDLFAVRFFWENFRMNFLDPLRWHAGFPYVWKPAAPVVSADHASPEFFFGALPALPVLMLALAAPLAWTGVGDEERRGNLGRLSAALGILFLAGALPVCLCAYATSRYLLDFLPALALLASLGLFGIERYRRDADTQRESRGTGLLRTVAYGTLLFSLGTGWLLAAALGGFYRGAEQARMALEAGHIDEAVPLYEQVCRINPDFRGQAELAVGSALLGQGRQADAVPHLRAAADSQPNLAAAHFNLGIALSSQGLFKEAGDAFRQAAHIDPTDAEAETELGVALFRQGRISEAIDHERAALRIDPNQAVARSNLQALESLPKTVSP